MSDAKITALTALTTLLGTDILPVVSDPGGTPITKKITAANMAVYFAALTEILTNKTLTSPTLQGTIDGWIFANETWTYASAYTITVPSGAASKYKKGDKIKWTQTTVKYGVILTVADTLLTIAVNTDYVVTNATISNNNYSHQNTPLGYPLYFNFLPTWGSTGTAPAIGNGSITGLFTISGGICFMNIIMTCGSSTTYGTGVYKWSLAVNALSNAYQNALAVIFDSGVAQYVGVSRFADNNTDIYMYVASTNLLVGPTVPMVWGDADSIQISLSYLI